MCHIVCCSHPGINNFIDFDLSSQVRGGERPLSKSDTGCDDTPGVQKPTHGVVCHTVWNDTPMIVIRGHAGSVPERERCRTKVLQSYT